MRRLPIAWVALLIASPASAEVADKEPSVAALWLWAAAFNVIALSLELFRPRLGLLAVPIAAFSGWATHSEITDPYVGPDILRELGREYVNASYRSAAFGLLGPLVIVLLCSAFRRRRAKAR